jgi:hypothetical protein
MMRRRSLVTKRYHGKVIRRLCQVRFWDARKRWKPLSTNDKRELSAFVAWLRLPAWMRYLRF